MKISESIKAVILTGILAVCGWTLTTVSDLKAEVAAQTAAIAAIKEQLNQQQTLANK